MRFYKLNGVWQSWDYLHNELGYAEHATRPTVFKSCADATWGEDAGNGYYDGDVSDMINGTFWTDADPTGWFDLDGLVWNSETYPADAAPSLLVKDGVASDALVITCDDGNYYLIRAIIDTTAWIPESEVEALGWRSPSFVVVDSTTGKIVSGCNQELTTYELPSVVLNSEDGYETYELPSISLAVPKMVIGVPMSGPVQAFWFTDNGRDETSDKTFTVVGNPLFDEDGSVARNELYDSVIPLSFMQHDGNMFEADSDSDIVRYLPVTDRLVLSIPGDSTTRDKSAWSVQVAKLFVLSYVNTQLPDVQIELPINEVGAYGTSITLPTIDGEYESGGKTWKPSAWDIGAFGDSYTLNADTVAHLLFEEVQQYQEITLYMVNENKHTQLNVTSGFTGNVVSGFCYQLYTDAECTIPWTNYDYSNEYVVGAYNDGGEWVPDAIQSVADMPDTATSSGFRNAFILMDTGVVWLASSSSVDYGYYLAKSSITLRIYPKAQQHYVRYLAYNNAYNNTTVTTANKSTYPAPTNGSSSNTSGWFQTFPKATITRLLMSAGNEAQSVLGDEIAVSTGYRMIFRQASAMSRTFRAIEYTLDRPTLHAWLKTDHTNKSTTSAALNDLYDDDGNLLMFDGDYSVVYVPIGLFVSGGANCSNNQLVLERATFGRRSSGEWCFIQSYAGVSIARVWYVKYTDCKVAYFNANKTNYTWAQGTTRVLYDANGNQIPYDSTKTYTIIQLRESSHLVIAPTFGDMALKSLINNVGYLACNAASGGQYSSLSVASVWYLEE